jgi:hypothetical protein
MPKTFTVEKNCTANETIDGRYMIDDVVITHGIGGVMPIVFVGDDVVGKIDVYVQFSHVPKRLMKGHKAKISIDYKPLSWLIYDKKMFKEKVNLLCYERGKEDKAKEEAKAEAQKSALGL